MTTLIISSALKQQDIQDLFHDKEIEGIKYLFVKKEGINLFFSTDESDNVKAIAIAKKTIKESPFGSALFFRVVTS